MVSINGLSVEFGATKLLDNISFTINPRDRIALTGRNGAGKSTLLKIIAGLQLPTGGSVSLPGDFTVGYLPQQMQVADETTVADETRKAFGHIDRLQARLKAINDELATRTDYESDEYHRLVQHASDLSEQVTMSSTDRMEAELERTLMGLGFRRTDLQRPTAEFSGGWRMRIELAKILLQRPDLLLLDEPTNHLDIESIQWLESFLASRAKAVVLVSHDRAFMDNVTSRTIEISLGHIYDYSVNYTRYVELRRERLEQQMRAYQNQQKQIKDTEEFIERFRYKATKAVQVQSRMKQLAKIERIEVDQVDTSHLNLRFPPAPRSGDFPLIIDNVGKAYGDHQVFDHATLTMRRGEKVAFVGRNGEGKTTMVKCIMGQTDYTGTLKIGHNVTIGYFAQNQAQLLDPELTVFDTIDRVAVGDVRTRIRDILGAFMFGGEASDKKVKVLSGGEKTRLAMIRLLLQPVNLLILDEPTNHLDLVTKDVLKQAIREFDGTVIVVSHDREFLDGLVGKVYAFADGSVRENLGGIYDFLAKHNAQIAQGMQPQGKSQPAEKAQQPTQASQAVPQATPARLSYAEQREREKALRRAAKAVTEAEAEVARLEQALADIEAAIAADPQSDADIYTRHAETNKALENAMSIWELAENDLEQLKERYGQK